MSTISGEFSSTDSLSGKVVVFDSRKERAEFTTIKPNYVPTMRFLCMEKPRFAEIKFSFSAWLLNEDRFVIGLGHRKRKGKDTLANFLGFPKFAQAYKLKLHCYNLFKHYGMQLPEYYDEHGEARETQLCGINKTPREIWIAVGNYMRTFDPDYWCAQIEIPDSGPSIVTDIRYVNEYTYFDSRFAFAALQVLNPNVPDSDDVADKALKGHDDVWNGYCYNGGSETQLKAAADAIKAQMFNLKREMNLTCL